jgi:aspartate/tyrosine/aromatic aminotransferase
MLDRLNPQPADKILSLMTAYRADPRADKIDLGVGVYKDATGLTPVMRAVKAAEKQLWDTETTKTYTALAGDPAFNTAMCDLILGDLRRSDRASVATPGGTGAVRQGLELMRMAAPQAAIWVSDPTWPNHNSIIRYLGITQRPYRYLDPATGSVDAVGMLADLGQARAGDVVLLHGCCHNPTGANLTHPQWAEVAALMAERGLIPMIDLAYQGFGDGLAADAAPTRLITERLPQVLIAASCSKNFGIYRERTGILIALHDAASQTVVQGNLAHLNRQNFSFPPDHGARLVTMILQDDALRVLWQDELEEIRLSMLSLRQALSDALRHATNSDRFDFVAHHRGMFSRLGLTEAQVERLRAERGIYMTGDARVNIAGLNTTTVPILARAVAGVI